MFSCVALRQQKSLTNVRIREGLFILIQPNGSRLWRMNYRFGGREKLLSFGAYPKVSLALARDAVRNEMRANR
ncbi:Arm DNA-binding domain-containing protein [Gluconobacter cerinus]